jgi:hypothetical protein
VLDIGHPRPLAHLHLYVCAVGQSYQRITSVSHILDPYMLADATYHFKVRHFNPGTYEDTPFVFSTTESAYTTSAEAPSSAAEGCSTPPTEYTPKLETSELPHFAIDPALLDNVHRPMPKKCKLDTLSSELEDHDANVPTFTGTHGRAGHPPARRFQSPFLPACKKICPSNQKNPKYVQPWLQCQFVLNLLGHFRIPIPSRFKVSTEIAPIRLSAPLSIRPSAPTPFRPSAPPSIRPSAPSSIRPTAPSKSNERLSTAAPQLTLTRSFLVHKPTQVASRPRPKPKPVGNTMQPLAFSKRPPVRDIPPAPQDDSDDAELEYGLLTRKSAGGSSKDKVSAHSRSQLESGRQHSMIQTMQGEILQLRKEQSQISQDHNAVTNRIDTQVEAIIRRLEALEVRDPQSAPSRTDNSMNVSTLCCLLDRSLNYHL